MKKALQLVLKYFLFLIFGILISWIFYVLYLSILNSVAGEKLTLLSWRQSIKPLFFIIACILLVICPAVSYARMRIKGGVAQTLFYVLLCALTWGLLFPLTIHFGQQYNFTTAVSNSNNSLTGGFFRQLDDKVYYFTDDLTDQVLKNKETAEIIIDTTQSGKTEVNTVTDMDAIKLYNKAYPYRDSLIKQSFSGEKKHSPYINLNFYIRKAVVAFNKGWTFYLGFLSLALALCAIYAFSNITDWRLINGSIVLFVTFLVLFLNLFYYQPMFEGFKRQYIDYNGFFRSFGKFVDDPLLVLINVIVSVIFITIGIIRFCLVVKKNKKAK